MQLIKQDVSLKTIMRKEVVNTRECWDPLGVRSHEYGSTKSKRNECALCLCQVSSRQLESFKRFWSHAQTSTEQVKRCRSKYLRESFLISLMTTFKKKVYQSQCSQLFMILWVLFRFDTVFIFSSLGERSLFC